MSYNERELCEHNKHFVSKVKNKNPNYVLFKFVVWKLSVLLKFDHRNNKSLIMYKTDGKINNRGYKWITHHRGQGFCSKIKGFKWASRWETTEAFHRFKSCCTLGLLLNFSSACMSRHTNPPVYSYTHSCKKFQWFKALFIASIFKV